MDIMQCICATESLHDLEAYLTSLPDRDALREHLFGEFMRYALYSDIDEWNVAVRLCESLAIIGWGAHEPLEAVRTQYVNGNPRTYFVNRYYDLRYVDAVWAKRGDGYVQDAGNVSFHASPDDPMQRPAVLCKHPAGSRVSTSRLTGQRNRIVKNPICITRTLDNCYPGSREVIDSIDEVLQPALDRSMRPELYGTEVNRIVINCAFSFDDGPHCKTNYIIADEADRLRPKDFYPVLRTMYDDEAIEANAYYLRNRYSIGPFRKDTGNLYVTIVFERDFSMQSPEVQRRTMAAYFSETLRRIGARLGGKSAYDFGLMRADFDRIAGEWSEGKTGTLIY